MEVKERWICTLKRKQRVEKIALGETVPSVQDKEEFELHVPSWFIDSCECSANEIVNVQFSCSSQLSRAMSLSFTLVGEIPEWLDLKDVLEDFLSQLGVLKRGQMLPVPLLEDGQVLLAHYESMDPHVFLHGDEIGLELITEAEPAVPVGTFRQMESTQGVDFASLFSAPGETKFYGTARQVGR
jgi:hypothetical protein